MNKCNRKRKRGEDEDSTKTSQNLKQMDSRPHVPRICKIQFGILSAEEIRRLSVVDVTEPVILDHYVPKCNGINDLRMGSVDRRFCCSTCGKSMMKCMGHTGSIELAFPIYHIHHLPSVTKILNCICYFCSSLLIEKNPSASYSSPSADEYANSIFAKIRFDKINKSLKKQTLCPNQFCKGPQPRYSYVINNHEIGVKIDWSQVISKYEKLIKKTKAIRSKEKDVKDEDPLQNIETIKEIVSRLTLLSKQPFTAADAGNILNGISKNTCDFLGLDYKNAAPKDMILSTLMVPPPIIRPAAMTAEGRARNHDDLTEKLKDIVDANKTLKALISKSTNGEYDSFDCTSYILKNKFFSSNILIAIRELQTQVTFLFNNDIRGLKTDRQRSGAATKSISKRWKGKEGRIRGNLCGKRVEFSARSVITPDPNIDLDEVGIPYEAALKLTFPDRANRWNIDDLRKRVAIGPNKIGGAQTVIYPDGTAVDLNFVENRERVIQIYYGCVVERYLKNGDLVIFNRQPSLHKQSMMGHKVVVLPYKTFRLNLTVVTPYNADFDGDEMNMHVIQSYEGQAEVQELMAVNENIIAGKPCMGLIQDSCLGVNFLTKRDNFFTREQFCQFITQCKHFSYFMKFSKRRDSGAYLPKPTIIKPKELWTGKQIFSFLLPEKFYYKKWRKEGNKKLPLDPMDNYVLIHDGELLSGRLCKDTLGSSYGSIHHFLCRRKNGNEYASKFLSDIQRVVNWYMMNRGFSIGIGDNILSPEIKKNINDTQDILIQKVRMIYEKMMDEEGFESSELEPHILSLLRKGLSITSAIADKHLDDKNAIWAMVHSGSKGNPVNIGQMTACLGQQSINGKRISGRPLPGFEASERHPASRGYVRNNLYDGLTSVEFFEHAIGGREGLVDTAVKTAVTGYIERCLMQALNDIVVEYDGTVRKSNGELIQFSYGLDGWDENKLMRVTLNFNETEPIEYEYVEYQNSLSKKEEKEEKGDKFSWISAHEEEMELLGSLRINLMDAKKSLLKDFAMLPDDLSHEPVIFEDEMYVIEHQNNHVPFKEKSDFDISFLINEVSTMIQKLRDMCGLNDKRDFYIRSTLTSKNMIVRRRWKKAMLSGLFDIVIDKYERATISPCEMVGSTAAENHGEPCTQMTLNTFHLAGTLARAMTAGIPRMRELFFLTKHISTPSTTIFILPELTQNQFLFFKWHHSLQEMFLDDLICSEEIQILYEPDPKFTDIKKDQDLIDLHRIFLDKSLQNMDEHSKWVLRVPLSKKKLVDRGLSPKDVARVIRQHMNFSNQQGPYAHNCIIASETCMKDWILRIRIPNVKFLVEECGGAFEYQKQFEKDLCLRMMFELSRGIRISGIPGITGSTIREEENNTTIIDTQGSNLLDIWLLDGIDWTKTYSNVLHEVEEYLGLEAASELLFYELKNAAYLASATISDRHVLMLTDFMTHRGFLMPINRHGFNQYNNAFARSAFEEAVENLMEAGLFGEIDPVQDIVSNMMVGQSIPAGTGRVNVLMKEDYINEIKSSKNAIVPKYFQMGKWIEGKFDDDVVMTSTKWTMQHVMQKSDSIHEKEDPLKDWIPPMDRMENLEDEYASNHYYHFPCETPLCIDGYDSTSKISSKSNTCSTLSYAPSSPPSFARTEYKPSSPPSRFSSNFEVTSRAGFSDIPYDKGNRRHADPMFTMLD